MSDVTGEAERAEARSTADLVNAAKLTTLGMLVAGVAHELNTPMGALNSNHDTLQRALRKLQTILADEVVEPEELEEVRRVVAAVAEVLRVNDLAIERMRHLVTSLRSFGRPDQAELDRVDIHESLDAALTILAHEMRSIEVQREFGELPALECYPQQLGQVFMNLLMNAVQAMSDTGTLTIRTSVAADGVAIEIRDTGVGIQPEHLARIFEPGFTTKGARRGMGLGLLITQQIIDRHGGRLAFTSEPGTGTSVMVSLPLRPQPAPPRT